jgi:hypothetical protein
MSGSAGGNRINRANVAPTVTLYQKTVLNKYDKYRNSIITGSYNTSNKNDFGDIDLIVELNATDKIQAKKDFASFITQLSPDIIVPFKSIKYKGKRFLSSGEIITVLFPISENNGYVQIDNIISLSPEETNFKNQFLSLPAIKQGLMLGLIKCVVIENPDIIEQFPIHKALQHDQEYEFNLSSSGLTLRIVTLTSNYKEINREDVWKTTNWNVVKKLLKNYDFSKSFEELIEDIKQNLHNPRSKNRVKGIFQSMVSTKSGEVGTPKGDEKEYALKIISKLNEKFTEHSDPIRDLGIGIFCEHNFKTEKEILDFVWEILPFLFPKKKIPRNYIKRDNEYEQGFFNAKYNKVINNYCKKYIKFKGKPYEPSWLFNNAIHQALIKKGYPLNTVGKIVYLTQQEYFKGERILRVDD